MSDPLPIFDGHLDLAYLAEIGRDMHARADRCLGTLLPASVTLPELHLGGVRGCLGTIFTEPTDRPADGPMGLTLGGASGMGGFHHIYPAGDAQAAHQAGRRQLRLYQAWQEAGLIDLLPAVGSARLVVGLLMEGADPITDPQELDWWAQQGVRVVGLAWASGSRYAGGNDTPERGLTDAGRDLVAAIDQAGLIHDLSHLSDRAADQLLERTDALVVASHSNPRTLVEPGNQRHLADGVLEEIGRRGGVVGVNLYAPFLDPACRDESHPRPGLHRVAECVRYVAERAGVHAVALGTDMDGGFPATRLPRGVRTHADLHALFELLREDGWSQADLFALALGNWARVLGLDARALAAGQAPQQDTAATTPAPPGS